MKLNPRIENWRFLTGEYGSRPGDSFGALRMPGPCGAELVVLFSDGQDFPEFGRWEHVSVSIRHRIPNWIDMCLVKDLFWGPEECVVQYHPPKSEYVNQHPNVLHLWRQSPSQCHRRSWSATKTRRSRPSRTIKSGTILLILLTNSNRWGRRLAADSPADSLGNLARGPNLFAHVSGKPSTPDLPRSEQDELVCLGTWRIAA